MSKNPHRVPVVLGLRYLQSLGCMKGTIKYLADQEQMETQYICVWFYKYGTGRFQTKINLGFRLFTYHTATHESHLQSNIIKVTFSGVVQLLTCDDSSISHS